jgi:hypothetical protein
MNCALKKIVIASWTSWAQLHLKKHGSGVRELNVENMNAESEARVQQPETRNSKFTARNGQRTTDNGRGDKLHATFFVLGWLLLSACPVLFAKYTHAAMK